MKFPPVYPALHSVASDIHTVDDVAAITSESVPGGHVIHDVADNVVEYVLLGHLVQDFEEVLATETIQLASNPVF